MRRVRRARGATGRDARRSRAAERFGRIDVWFSNAGIAVFGRLESVPSDVWRRVVETNLFGHYHGAKVAMRQFRAQVSACFESDKATLAWTIV